VAVPGAGLLALAVEPAPAPPELLTAEEEGDVRRGLADRHQRADQQRVPVAL
jgi:hypothetical protein